MEFALHSVRLRSLRGQLIGLVAALAVPLIALQVWWGYREWIPPRRSRWPLSTPLR